MILRLTDALRRRLRSERGAFSAMMVTLIVMLVVVAGLVVDGGHVLNARAQTYDDLEQAARVGANQIDENALRTTGAVQLIPAAAEQEAVNFLRGLPRDDAYGPIDPNADVDSITVWAERTVRTRLLSLVGVESIPVQAEATADAVVGIDGP